MTVQTRIPLKWHDDNASS